MSIDKMGTAQSLGWRTATNSNGSITQAEKKNAESPSVAEIKAIATAGFIYGLPIVMNYAVNVR